ncbi:HNH endonuclease [Cellulomonas shaoxiangyii]|uniref:HNH endonuclease n=1 Tax=Cellulomonas shaoxiangyii TaxID=2566013 RepID=A0A4P7SFM6_9CELL|nr:HNH endonuclease [Cellulomonas shaoxiangyii]QCB92351.1 HNH endonuclease [Cellulomonas shaoxiangyii]TGY86254.1 HNH endonuclease [Cellulomonas shaoxiangyii]
MPYDVKQYLGLTLADAEAQWRSILARAEVGPGENQVDYVPVETLLCAAAMVALGNVSYGSGLASRGPTPIPELAHVFRRRRTSITSKMANLEGGRSRGGRSDQRLWEVLRDDHRQLFDLYRVILAAARRTGARPELLPDFLELEHSDTFELLGQDEIDETAVEAALRERLEQYTGAGSERPSERQVLARVRIDQHRFAKAVLINCGWECVFCGFGLTDRSKPTLLRASHIKPWRSSDDHERRDVRNGVAACPTHDAAFDAGDLTLSEELEVIASARITSSSNPAVRLMFGAPLLRQHIRLLPGGHSPRPDYLDWHRERIFLT